MSDQNESEYVINILKSDGGVDSIGMAETDSEYIEDRRLAVRLYKAKNEALKQKIAAIKNATNSVSLESCLKDKKRVLESMCVFRSALLNKQEQIKEKLKIAENLKIKLSKAQPDIQKKYAKKSKQMDKLLKKKSSRNIKSFRSLKNIGLFN